MKLRDCRDAYEATSGKASDIARQLAFAGIALIWVFKIDSGGQQVVPTDLHFPARLIVIGLGLDLAQYFLHAVTYWVYFRIKEGQLNNDQKAEFTSPRLLPVPFWAIWAVKILVIAAAYGYLLCYLVDRVA